MTWITALEVSGVFTAQDRKLDWVGNLTVAANASKANNP